MAVRPGYNIEGWEVTRKLGQGTFADVFEGVNLSSRVQGALKVAKPGPPLQWESEVLVKLQKYSIAPRHYGLL
jgi:serine/threonine protein kinase